MIKKPQYNFNVKEKLISVFDLHPFSQQESRQES
jgi:hypothetical protein